MNIEHGKELLGLLRHLHAVATEHWAKLNHSEKSAWAKIVASRSDFIAFVESALAAAEKEGRDG